ncbi:AlbA family DNA-binding domain-containing protein [Haloarchaeobius sp. DT45]|uniref:AlbA family DNA-binding domain-containing protein n=1 Tax=Haloarchaeobius sp. DT45 TaxID=3446116 RepID=UPI003F6D285C
MDTAERINQGDSEDEKLDYKAKGVSPIKIAKELVAFANAKGGSVVLGVPEDDGRPAKIQNIEHPHHEADNVSDAVSDRVMPTLEFERKILNIEGNTVIELSVTSSERIHSYKHPKIDEPVFPVRHNATTRYMHGHDLEDRANRFASSSPEKESDSDLLRLPEEEVDQSFGNFFIKAPEGHISDICIFSKIHYPGNPVRVTLKGSQLLNREVEHIFAVLESLLGISNMDSTFTINQSNAAWIGSGFQNFVANLRNQEVRYENATQDEEYDLDLYKHEQAVFISDFGIEYPESVLIIYAAPFVNHDMYRYFVVNLIIDGQPVDVRPLIEIQENTELLLDTGIDVTISSDGIRQPSRIPVKPTELSVQDGYVNGALCQNPFYNRRELLERELEIERVDPLSKYSDLYCHLMNWHDEDEQVEYESLRFVVTDWDEFTKGVYANVKEVQFLADC